MAQQPGHSRLLFGTTSCSVEKDCIYFFSTKPGNEVRLQQIPNLPVIKQHGVNASCAERSRRRDRGIYKGPVGLGTSAIGYEQYHGEETVRGETGRSQHPSGINRCMNCCMVEGCSFI